MASKGNASSQSSSLKGLRSATSNTPFRFLDLPAELRNMIYTLLLVESEHIRLRIRTIIRKWRHERGMACRPETKISTVILRVNRSIHAEATPILYGMNSFKIEPYGSGERNLHRFLSSIGKSTQHIRHINIPYFRNLQEMRSALHLLKEAKSIETFDVGCYLPRRFDKQEMNWNKMIDPVKNMQVFLPWLRSLRKARNGGSNGKDVTDVFRLQEVPPADYYGEEGKYQEVCAQMQKYFAKFIADLQKALN